MANSRNHIERRMAFLEKVYLEDRERWRKSEERWRKNEERWQKNEERWQKNEERWEKNEEHWQKNEEHWQKVGEWFKIVAGALVKRAEENRRQGERLDIVVRLLRRKLES